MTNERLMTRPPKRLSRFSDPTKKKARTGTAQFPDSPIGLDPHNWLQEFAQTGILSLSRG